MCLLLALNNSTNAPLTSQLARWVSAFGGEPIAIDTNSTPAVQGLTATAQGQAIRAPAPRFSGRHGGICRVIYGLLKQHWSERIVIELRDPMTLSGMELRLRTSRLIWKTLQGRLLALIAHLDTYASDWGRAARP